tara:strand:- start:156 stop:386 length:231 start_codon:yes stop_codon:yes gene_type:complete
MKPREQLIKDGIINENKNVTYSFIASFYRDQLKKFLNIGLGGKTEFGVRVTDGLIKITRKRLNQIRPMKGENNGTV